MVANKWRWPTSVLGLPPGEISGSPGAGTMLRTESAKKGLFLPRTSLSPTQRSYHYGPAFPRHPLRHPPPLLHERELDSAIVPFFPCLGCAQPSFAGLRHERGGTGWVWGGENLEMDGEGREKRSWGEKYAMVNNNQDNDDLPSQVSIFSQIINQSIGIQLTRARLGPGVQSREREAGSLPLTQECMVCTPPPQDVS